MKLIIPILLIASVFCQTKRKNPFFSMVNPVIKDGQGGMMVKFLRSTNLDKVIESNVPVFLRDAYKVLVTEPPKRINYRRPKKPVSIKDIKDNYLNSLLSDCTSEQFKKRTCGCRKTYPEVYGVESQSLYSQGAVAVNQKMKKLIVSYRGTKNMQNNINDLSYSLIDSPNLPYGAQVAEGFYTYHLSLFKSLCKYLEPMLDNPRYRDYTIQITGFSLGAAAAMAGVPDWIQFLKNRKDHHKIEVYGYSGPRSGNPQFAKFINQLGIPVIRYTNFKDFIPQFPPRAANFAHAGVEVHQTSLGPVSNNTRNLKICSSFFDEDPKCSWSHHKAFDFTLHAKPFSLPIAIPPFC